MTYDHFAVYSLPCTEENLETLERTMRRQFGFSGVLSGRKHIKESGKQQEPLELTVTTPQHINSPYHSSLIWDFRSNSMTVFATDHIPTRFCNMQSVRSFYLVMNKVVNESGGRVTHDQASLSGNASPPSYALRFR